MTRTYKAGIICRRVQTAWIFPYVHLQIAVGTQKPPFRKDSPICKKLRAVSAAAHLIPCNEGSDDVDRGRVYFQEGCTWLCCSKMGVMVIEHRNIGREIAVHLREGAKLIQGQSVWAQRNYKA